MRSCGKCNRSTNEPPPSPSAPSAPFPPLPPSMTTAPKLPKVVGRRATDRATWSHRSFSSTARMSPSCLSDRSTLRLVNAALDPEGVPAPAALWSSPRTIRNPSMRSPSNTEWNGAFPCPPPDPLADVTCDDDGGDEGSVSSVYVDGVVISANTV